MTRAWSCALIVLLAAAPVAAAAPAAAPAAPAAPAGGAGEIIPPESMKDISFEGLDADKKALAVALFNEYGCDCGCGMKVARCRRDDSTCGRSIEIANQVLGLIKEGKTRDEIVKAAFQPPSKFVQFAIPAGDSPSFGPKDAPVTVLHYVDYQCPFCERAVPAMKQLVAAYPKDVRVVIKQHPLPMHAQAQIAAEAALAAHAQGKFLEMHEKLFQNRAKLSRERILALAAEIGLDVPRFTKELDDHVHAAAVAREVAEAEKVGASGTPASFVNGRFVSGAKPFDFFKTMVDEELAWARAGNRPEFKTGKNVSEAAAPKAPPKGLDPNKVFDLPTAGGPTKGAADAPVTVLHYFDYQCPVCKRVAPTVEELLAAYPKDVRVVYKMRPLRSHKQAMVSAEAALAAHAQGKFFEMHAKLYEHQAALSPEKIRAIAQEIGLDMARFDKELAAHTYKAEIDAEVAAVQAIGSTATPTTFVNGRALVGAQPLASFQRLVDEAIAKGKGGEKGAGAAAAGRR